MNIIVYDAKVFEEARKLTKGYYQEGIARGRYNWSGSDLRGKASLWSSRYKTRRLNWFWRCRQKGLPVYIATGSHGKLLLQYGGHDRPVVSIA